MTETARQPKGIPTGGQFAATAHAEPEVSLTSTAVTPPEQKDLLAALSEKRQELHRLQGEVDLMTVDAAIGSVRRHFPNAARLYVDRAKHGWTGQPLDSFEAKGIRDADGHDITPNDPHWYYRRDAGDDQVDPGVSIHLSRLGNRFFGYEHEGISYDMETGDYVIDMDHKFSA
jgi:hypothetical protein